MTSRHRRGPGCVTVTAFKGVYSSSLALLSSRFPWQGPHPPSCDTAALREVPGELQAQAEPARAAGAGEQEQIRGRGEEPGSALPAAPCRSLCRSDGATQLCLSRPVLGDSLREGSLGSWRCHGFLQRRGVVPSTAVPGSSWVITLSSTHGDSPGQGRCPVQTPLRAHIAGNVLNKHPPCGGHRGPKAQPSPGALASAWSKPDMRTGITKTRKGGSSSGQWLCSVRHPQNHWEPREVLAPA